MNKRQYKKRTAKLRHMIRNGYFDNGKYILLGVDWAKKGTSDYTVYGNPYLKKL